MRVDVRTGRQEEFIALAPGEQALKYPSLAGNRRIIYWANTKKGADSEVRLVSLDNPKHPVTVVKSAGWCGVRPRHALLPPLRPLGRAVVRRRDRSVLGRTEAGGRGWTVVGQHRRARSIGAIGPCGRHGAGLPVVQPVWMDRNRKGAGRPRRHRTGSRSPDISVDGRRVAVSKIGQSESAAGYLDPRSRDRRAQADHDGHQGKTPRVEP